MPDPVVALQARLAKLGFPEVKPDGDPGPKTVRAALIAMLDGRISGTDNDIMAALPNFDAKGFDFRRANRIIVRGRVVQTAFPAIPYRFRGLAGFRPRRPKEDVRQVILHHDMTQSARHTWDVFAAKGTSSHGCVNRDGVFWQFLDLEDDVGFHALGHVTGLLGKPKEAGFNARSVGLDINNPCTPDLPTQGDRGIETVRVGSRSFTFLRLFPVQVDTTIQLLRLIRQQIPAVTADTWPHYSWKGDIRPDTPGIWAHHAVSQNRVCDPFGFPWARIPAEVGP